MALPLLTLTVVGLMLLVSGMFSAVVVVAGSVPNNFLQKQDQTFSIIPKHPRQPDEGMMMLSSQQRKVMAGSTVGLTSASTTTSSHQPPQRRQSGGSSSSNVVLPSYNKTDLFGTMIANANGGGSSGDGLVQRTNHFSMVVPEPYPVEDFDPDCNTGIPYMDPNGVLDTICLRLPPTPTDPENFCFPGYPEINSSTQTQTGKCAGCPNNSTNDYCVEATYDCGPHGSLSGKLRCVCEEDWYTSPLTQQCTRYSPAVVDRSSLSYFAPNDVVPVGVNFGPQAPFLSTAEVVLVCFMFALIPGWFILARDLDIR